MSSSSSKASVLPALALSWGPASCCRPSMEHGPVLGCAGAWGHGGGPVPQTDLRGAGSEHRVLSLGWEGSPWSQRPALSPVPCAGPLGELPPTWGPSATCYHPRLGLRGHCAGENGVTLHGADLSPTLRGESRSWAQGGWGAHHPETGPLSIGFPDQGVVGPAQRGQWALAGVPVHAGLPAALHWPHLVQVPALLQG